MSDQDAVILDTLTNLYCTSYSTSLPRCQWGTKNYVVFTSMQVAEAAARDMNNQVGSERFIGANPRPR